MRRRIARKLSGRPFFKSVVLLSGGTAAAQVITILSTPIVTRLYQPEHFGILTVFVSILGIVIPLATLRYAVAIPIAEDEGLADDVLRLCFVIIFTLAIFFAMGLLLFGPTICRHYPDSNVSTYFWLLPFCLFGAGLYQALSSWSLRDKQFKLLARTRMTQGVSSATTKIALGALGVRPLGLLLGYFTTQVTGSGSILMALVRQKPGFFRKYSWRGMWRAAKRFVRFPLLQSWSQLLLALGVQLPALLIAAFYNVKAAGFYGLAFNMVNMPMNILGQSIAQVYFAEIAKYGKARPDKILSLSVSLLKKLFVLGAIPAAVIMAVGPHMFGLVFGEEWREAGGYAQLLSVLVLLRFVSVPVAHCLNVLERQGLQIIINSIRVLLVVAVFTFCRFQGFNVHTTVLIYSISISVMYLALAGTIFQLLRALVREMPSSPSTSPQTHDGKL